jgi:hypothetical protein
MLKQTTLVEWKWLWQVQIDEVIEDMAIVRAHASASSVTLRKACNLSRLQFYHLFSACLLSASHVCPSCEINKTEKASALMEFMF